MAQYVVVYPGMGYLKLRFADEGEANPKFEDGFSIVVSKDNASTFSWKDLARDIANRLNKMEGHKLWEIQVL